MSTEELNSSAYLTLGGSAFRCLIHVECLDQDHHHQNLIESELPEMIENEIHPDAGILMTRF